MIVTVLKLLVDGFRKIIENAQEKFEFQILFCAFFQLLMASMAVSELSIFVQIKAGVIIIKKD